MRILCDDVREAFADGKDDGLYSFVLEMQRIILSLPNDWIEKAKDQSVIPRLRQESMEAIQRLICEDAT